MPETASETSGTRRPFYRRHRWLAWTLGAALLFVIGLSIVLAVAARHIEPYLRARIIAGLSQRFHARVDLRQFHVAVHHGQEAEWGLWATGEGLRIWPPEHAGEPPAQIPLIEIDEFSFHVPLRYAQTQSLFIREVRLSGVHVELPPHPHEDEREGIRSAMATPPASPSTQSTLANVRIARVLCRNAEIVFESSKPNKPPVTFVISQMELKHLVAGEPAQFAADLTNPRPRGTIHTSGDFGPWVASDPGASPMRGSYQFKDADLSTIKDIAGTLQSTGTYTGVLGSLLVDGTATVPNFSLTQYGTALPLKTQFKARVDGTNGDTWLDAVDATLGSAHFTTSGKIVRVRVPGQKPEGKPQPGATSAGAGNAAAPAHTGHIIDLKVDIADTPVEDFLRLVSHGSAPILTGNVAAHARLHIPPGPEHVSRRIKIDGAFQLQDARFTEDKLQQKVEDLSLRGQGHPGDVKKDNIPEIHSEMQSDFHLDQAVMTLPNLEYKVPGADILLHGTYGLDGQLHFDGTARMQASVSQMVGGWKGFLLKPVDPFFRKGGAGTVIPIRVRGTRKAPDFGIDLGRIRHTSPQRPDAK